MSVEQYNADWDKHQSQERNDAEDTQHYNEGSSHFQIPDSLTKELVSTEPELLPDKARWALYYAPENSESQQRVIARLIDIGEYSLANEISACRNRFKVHECEDCEGENTTPLTCNRRDLCEDCRSHQGGSAQGKYGDIVTEWSRPTYLCLKLPGTYSDPSDARESLLSAFNSFKRRKVTPGKEWLNKLSERDPEFVDRIKEEYLDKDHGVPMSELFEGWILGRHSLYQQDTGEWKVHIDMLANARYIPAGKMGEPNRLGEIWSLCGGEKESVQIMRIRNRDGFRRRTAVMKTLAYVTDKVDCDDAKALVEYQQSTKGERRSIVGGSLHGNSDSRDSDTVELRCGHCGSRDLRETGITSSKPEGSTDALLFANGERVHRGNKFSKLIPSD